MISKLNGGLRIFSLENNDLEELKSVSYCGLSCPGCPLFGGKISEMAKDLRRELRNVQYDKFAKYISKFSAGKELKDFKECYSFLGALMKFSCENGCRMGGGSHDCEIKQCNLEKNYQGCWKCSKYQDCKKLDSLNALHGNTHRKNLATIRKKGILEFLKQNNRWYK